ncbi:isopeptide-forming domain-containing fimbrial protein [Bifidobacterium leontopitheci]|uniref:SpaA-like prealbumin fold domain-containing protein n=1 Tax=Bifidobacterium leontopitheci TaxID=2650774 RepID=A0A6I1GFI6_9BIFI|nr:isopeptide-forming domain-containing fimbrial protein [Bifidobacterium leontopitheci]KAB7790410.1 hypothetical protein F7D09_1096 [Bifidobacterium leontopitheci]
MKLKKILAGIAAVATLATGMAFGATTANADAVDMPADATPSTITLNKPEGADTSRSTYTAYRIAAYTDPVVADNKLTSVGLNPVDGSQWDAKISAAIKAAGIDTTGSKSNLYALANLNTTTDAAKLRAFVDNLSVPTKLGSDEPAVTGTTLTVGEATTVPDQGWYFVTDSHGTNLLVGTALTDAAGNVYTTLVNTANSPATEQQLGVVDVKPEPPAAAPTVAKRVYRGTTYRKATGTASTANIGDTLTYVVSSVIPTTTAGQTAAFTFTDNASAGLDVNAGSIKVFYDNDTDDRYNDGDTLLTAGTDYTLTGPTATADGTLTKVTVNDVTGNDGKTLVLLYQATATKAAPNQQVTNSATATYADSAPSQPATTKVSFGWFSIKKVDSRAAGIKGATFTVRDWDNGGQLIKFEKGSANGTWVRAADQNATVDNVNVFTDMPSNAGGALFIWGLASGGRYTVMESKAAEGYAQQYRAGFYVSFDANGSPSIVRDKYLDSYNLVTLRNKKGEITNGGTADPAVFAQVLNVKNIAELPLTGGTGTMLFAAATVVFGIVGVALFKVGGSRRARRRVRA